jgi:hypothetical protein
VKFKVGDRVILNCPKRKYLITESGWTGVITVLGEKSTYVKWDKVHIINNELSVEPVDLELEEVYFSPLYQALL